jgi:serine/threonine protein kinase, bacterial
MTYTSLQPSSQHPGQPPGATFAGYTLLRLLGSGGMGEVYLAQHPRLPRRDALKILGNDVSADDDYRQRFINEADLAAVLWHPNIVRVNDRGEFNGQLWISMDFVDGTDAASLLRDRYPAGMPADEVATIVAAVASALDYAHQHDLLHRDVKPANILLTNPGDGEQRILLSDFGIARNIGDVSGLTATNMTMGTLPYAAPEQLMDEPMDGRADQYALAATAYHLLTGSPLFPQSNPAVVISRHLTASPPALADSHPELAALDDPVLATALAKDPADRFTRCTDFARAFAQAAPPATRGAATALTMPAPVASRPPVGAAVPLVQADTDGQERRRRPWLLVAAAIAVVAITATGVIGYMIEKNNTASKPAPPAAVLDGTYRLDFDFAKATSNGAPYPQSTPSPTDGQWWAFRSSCASGGCIATGTLLDDKNHQVAATPGHTAELHFRDGHWQRTPFQIQAHHQRCLGGDGKIAAGADTESVAWSAQPMPDGTLRGLWSEIALTNECGYEGGVLQAPLVATRTGDVPPTVSVADPATVTATPMTSSPIPAVAGVTPVLDGTFRVDYDVAKQTMNGQATTGSTPPPPRGLPFVPCAHRLDASPQGSHWPTKISKRP